MKKNKLTQFLTEALILEESGFSWQFRLALAASVAVFLLSVLVASQIHMNEAVIARGQFRPKSFVHKVQPSEGGIVEEIRVQEGDRVTKGALLLRLKNATTTANQEQTEGRLAGSMARAARLQAFLLGKAPDFSGVPGKYKELIRDQMALLQAQNQSRKANQWVFATQEEQKRAEISQIEEEIKSTHNRAEIDESLLSLQSRLAKKNLAPRVTQLEAKRAVLGSTKDVRSLEIRLNKARASLQEVILKRKSFDDDLMAQAQQELGEVNSEVAQMREVLNKLDDHRKRLDIRSPIAGRVQNLRFRTIGAVAAVGDLLLQVIPEDDEVILDMNISPKDIGFVRTGQAVVMRVTSFDADRYGTVSGVLTAISPFTYMDPDKQVYYKGTVRPEKRTVGRSGQNYFILPGMWADAEIITGSRSLLEYLLKPLLVPLTVSASDHLNH
ncbi:MAG: HlyD family type I secretion periplasmic adaptor subunit [Magnetococcales bacterium]|nr:HlyD family type I secretion periplasmic adaptor subunit [Magnetococcales bacterium]MBF0437114.1 HlyD family type I secretion periplasmic adaptor subunit [Magnetococcales bacterium]